MSNENNKAPEENGQAPADQNPLKEAPAASEAQADEPKKVDLTRKDPKTSSVPNSTEKAAPSVPSSDNILAADASNVGSTSSSKNEATIPAGGKKDRVITIDTKDTLYQLQVALFDKYKKVAPSQKDQTVEIQDATNAAIRSKVESIIKDAKEILGTARKEFRIPEDTIPKIVDKVIVAESFLSGTKIDARGVLASAVAGNAVYENENDKAAAVATVKKAVLSMITNEADKQPASKEFDKNSKAISGKSSAISNPNVVLGAALVGTGVGVVKLFGKKAPKLENGQEVPQHKSLLAKIGAIAVVTASVVVGLAAFHAKKENKPLSKEDFSHVIKPVVGLFTKKLADQANGKGQGGPSAAI